VNQAAILRQLDVVLPTDDDFLSLPDLSLPDLSLPEAELAEPDELPELESLDEPEPFLDSDPVDDEPFAAAEDDSLPAPTELLRLSVR
jgi:hypothetical protein